MPTENDLRDTLVSLERHAPDPAAVLPYLYEQVQIAADVPGVL